MADKVKTRLRSKVKKDDIVSVPISYFSKNNVSDDSEREELDNEPDGSFCGRFYGTVIAIFDDYSKVKWKCDGTTSLVSFDDFVVESEPPTFESDTCVPKSKVSGISLFANALNLQPVTSDDTNVDFSQLIDDNKEDTEIKDAAGPSGVKRKGKKQTKKANKKQKQERETNDSDKSKVKVPKKRKVVETNETASNLKEVESESDLNVLDYDEGLSEDESAAPLVTAKKAKSEDSKKSLWKKGGWKTDPRKVAGQSHSYGPRINMDTPEQRRAIDFLLRFLPVIYIREVIISVTNVYSLARDSTFKPLSFEELMIVLGIIYAMEVYHLPERRMYWRTEKRGVFPALNFGQYISLNRFEEILRNLQFSAHDDDNEQILAFIDAVNKNFKSAVVAGDTLCLDESMVKSYHRNLKGKMKIKRKPRPIGNEFKTVCDGRSKIVTHMELYEGKEFMAKKQFVDELGATAATCLRLTESYKASGRMVIADSWFGSVKSAIELWLRNGLYSIMLVKTAHKNYPKELLAESKLGRGKWNSAHAEIDGVKMLAVKFLDLQDKQFIGTCSSDLPGPPRKTKHCGEITRPIIAFDYLESAAGIDIHNHVRTGSKGFEDVWMTKNPILRQFAGIMGFVFANAFLAMKYFGKYTGKHVDFKEMLANEMIMFEDIESANIQTRGSKVPAPLTQVEEKHSLIKLAGKGQRLQKPCFYCQHGLEEGKCVLTSYCCSQCGTTRPLCPPTSDRLCFEKHVSEGMPQKRYKKKANKH